MRKKNIPYKWGEQEEKAFHALKQHIVNATRLVPYRSEYPLILATDASSLGIGAVLSTRHPDGNEYPIAFASKTLNDHERQYSQIEKEALSIIFGVKKFHQYLYGRCFELLTDHKPLVSLFHPNKQLPVYTLARLQRWAITLMSYQFVIRYRATEHHCNADALSRLPVGPDPAFDKMEESCCWIFEDQMQQLSAFPINAKLISEETKKDPLLRQVLNFLNTGWPEKPSEEIKPFHERRWAITVVSGVLVLETDNPRVIIPRTLQPQVLKQLHVGHWGIVRMKQMARKYCWWVHIDKEIEALAKTCQPCQKVKPNPPKQFQSWPSPQKPWERVHMDFAGPFWGSMWFVLVDSFSKYPFVVRMAQTTTEAVIQALKQIFLTEGPPETLVSDNGPQFVSKQFEEFCTRAGITHLTTAPFHPASNGEAERWVRTFKEAMKKAWWEKRDKSSALDTLLFSYRTTVLSSGKSPAEWLHGRQPRTALSLLLPHQQASHTQKSGSKFSIGETVHVKFFTSAPWELGKVVEHLGSMMYVLDTERGFVRRHQNQLRKTEGVVVSGERKNSNATDFTWLPPQQPMSSGLVDRTSSNPEEVTSSDGLGSSQQQVSSREEEEVNSEEQQEEDSRPLMHEQRQGSTRRVTFHPTVPRRSARTRKPVQRYSP